MATAVPPTAPTIEGQALELARELQTLESAQSTAELPLNNVQIDTDIEGGLITVTMQLPVELGGTGADLTLSAGVYLS